MSNWDPQVKEIFLKALKLSTPEERAAFLSEACAGKAELRAQVDSLLEAHQQAGTFLEKPGAVAPGETVTLSTPLTEKPGDRIGRYKLLQHIGEGGYGVVYMAEQQEPIRRRVALKVIKLGMDTKAVIARFEAERQALALMDHPNIAKVLDAGATDTGRPYFVMELVRGIKITDYCDQNNLPTEQRLDLYVQICHAIQHAHQKGIIHRDIKPSNILVTLHDGKPLPKIIDFGIAKATSGQELTDKTIFTAFEQFIGTPAYMSPEQAEMSTLDIDTRSDIYALGVLLYELLTGRTPFGHQELMAAGLNEMRRMIREQEPLRPSTRISTLEAADQTVLAKRRHAEPPQLIRLVRGDLDWIVMKCLEKDRARRYETANALAHDILCHLHNEPVLARPPSRVYRFQKMVRRNKLAVAAASAVVLALLLGFTVSTWEAVRATRAEALAIQTRTQAEKLSNYMLDDFYEVLGPVGQIETVSQLTRHVLAYYDDLPRSLRTPDTARNRAAAQARLAWYVSINDAEAAMPLAKEAVATLEQLRQQGDQSEGTMRALGEALYAQASCDWFRNDYKSMVGPVQRGIELLRPFATSANGSRQTKLNYAELLNLLSFTQPPKQGVATCEEALRILDGLGASDLSDLTATSRWANIADTEARELLAIGRWDDAERLEKQVQTLAERVLEHRPADLQARIDLFYASDVLALVEASRFHDDGALRLTTQSHQAAQDYLRFDPSNTFCEVYVGTANCGISSLLFREGRAAEALQKARAAIQSDRHPSGTGNSYWIAELGSALARWEAQREDHDGANQALQEARRSCEAILGGQRALELTELLKAAERQVKLASGEYADVRNMSKDAVSRLDKLIQGATADPPRHAALVYFTRQAHEVAARAALNLGHYDDAETAARALLLVPSEAGGCFSNGMEHILLDEPDDVVWGQVLLAQAVVGQGRNAEALKMLEPALAHYRDDQAHGAAFVSFRQHFARALYVQALAEPADSAGTALARESLSQALALLQGLTDEARQLHDSKELLTWIATAQKKLASANGAAEPALEK
jgi:serine/threonine protein kinase